MTFKVEVEGLGVQFGAVQALRDVSLTIEGGTISGLLGRNGAGKSTLLSTLAAHRRPSAGRVLVDGEEPYENARLMSDICLVKEAGNLSGGLRVSETLGLGRALRPQWDQQYADHLIERFSVPLGRKVGALSRGKQAALAVTVGLASRAPLTLFDEPHLGMDAAARYVFYDELLSDYLGHPRTIIVSTHLIDEVASLLEDVVIIEEGEVILHEPAEDLRTKGIEVTGDSRRVDDFTAGMPVLSERTLGPTKAVTVLSPSTKVLMRNAADAGVDLGPIALQDLFVSLTSKEKQT